MLTRRDFLRAGGLALAGVALPRGAHLAGMVEIRMMSDPTGADVWFDPIGVLIQAGDTVRWVVEANVHTTTAYHPKNEHHSLRIPERAMPWDSGFLTQKGQHFDVTLTVEGVYDYFCQPHEIAGMVGRVIVGHPTGPGALPFDYFKSRSTSSGWQPVPPGAAKAFPAIEAIVKQRIVRRHR